MTSTYSSLSALRLPIVLSVIIHLVATMVVPLGSAVNLRVLRNEYKKKFKTIEIQRIREEPPPQPEPPAEPKELVTVFSDILYNPDLNDRVTNAVVKAAFDIPQFSEVTSSHKTPDMNVSRRGFSDQFVSNTIKAGDPAGVVIPVSAPRKVKHVRQELDLDRTLAKAGREQLTVPDGFGSAAGGGIGIRSVAASPPLPLPSVREKPAAGTPTFDIDKRPLAPGDVLPAGKVVNTADIAIAVAAYASPDDPFPFIQIMLTAQESKQLKPVPKDVMFAVDVSLSMSETKINEARLAASQYLPELGPNDRFNVVIFSESIKRAFPDFVEPTPANIEQAVAFIKKIPMEIKTDVYSAIQSICSSLPETKRPCNIFLISDGKGTQGVRDAKRILIDFAAVLPPNVSIFTFDSGGGGNRYLLDLLSWVSRGQSVLLPQAEGASQSLVRLARLHDKPVLSSLRAVYANLNPEECYPRNPACLYKDQPIVLYGHCETTSNIALQIVGQADEGERFFFQNIVIPQPDPRNQHIAREWARGKIHYLMSRMARSGDDPALIKEIKQLGQKYAVPTPYTD
ncbi:MAG TPA: VWA domain-containing protein [Planctomycetota bacterium]|nr:VWA domain-containing protein [Planctomycetota bacterium]